MKSKANKTSFKKGHLAAKGKNHHAWKEQVSYSRAHQWMGYWFGKPDFCEHCGSKNMLKRYEWANISKKYKKDRTDWLRLCKSCHIKYDGSCKKIWAKRRKNGTDKWKSN